jgi:predicted MPP superfamily phosphohydrolase
MDFPRAFFVLSIFLAGYLALQYYLFIRFRAFLTTRLRDEKRRDLLCGSAAFFLLAVQYPVIWRGVFGQEIYEPFPWLLRGFAAFWTFGSTGAALVLLGYSLLRRFLPALMFRSEPPSPVDVERRSFLKKSMAVATVAPFAVSGYGVVIGPRRFEVEHFQLPMDGLSSDLSQLTIAQLTDIHVGPFMPKEELLAYVEAVNRLKPDLVALTGDFVAASPTEVVPCVEALAELKARLGVFACLGNHDFYARAADDLARLLEESGIRVLRNDAVAIPTGNSSIQLLGIEDLRVGEPDLPRALQMARKADGEVRVLLSHRPEIFPEAARKGIDIVLSGHYHGGQIKLAPRPGAFSIASLITPYAEGLFHLQRSEDARKDGKGALLFVSRGIGITGLPVRVNCSPQIAHLTLKRA